MTTWILLGVAAIALLITVDTVKGMISKRHRVTQNQNIKVERVALQIESERVRRVEADVQEKMNEINRHQSERLRDRGPAPQAAPKPERDTLNDTRCMQAVKEKADEIERIVREKGLSKS